MKTAQEVIKESDAREESLKTAIAQLEEIKSRYCALVELAPVFNALRIVRSRRPSHAEKINLANVSTCRR